MKYKKGDIVKVAFTGPVPHETIGIINCASTTELGTECYTFFEYHGIKGYISKQEFSIDNNMIVKHYGNDLKLLEAIEKYHTIFNNDISRKFLEYIYDMKLKDKECI